MVSVPFERKGILSDTIMQGSSLDDLDARASVMPHMDTILQEIWNLGKGAPKSGKHPSIRRLEEEEGFGPFLTVSSLNLVYGLPSPQFRQREEIITLMRGKPPFDLHAAVQPVEARNFVQLPYEPKRGLLFEQHTEFKKGSMMSAVLWDEQGYGKYSFQGKEQPAFLPSLDHELAPFHLRLYYVPQVPAALQKSVLEAMRNMSVSAYHGRKK